MKKNIVPLLLVAFVASFVSLGITSLTDKNNPTKAAETVFERVMRTRTLKCGYFIWPPFLDKDANTGELSGIYVDYMNAISAITDLKIEWAQELNFGTYLQDLENGRYDMECAGGWQNAKRAQHVFYVEPYAFIPYVAIVRADDTRFDETPDVINDKNIKISTIDGEMASMFRLIRFPLSQNVSLPQNSLFSDVVLNVTTKKADITFSDALSAQGFAEKNPGTIKIITYDPPLNLIVLSASVPPDSRMKQMFDVANQQLLDTGVVENILKKYESKDAQFLRVAVPFKKP